MFGVASAVDDSHYRANLLPRARRGATGWPKYRGPRTALGAVAGEFANQKGLTPFKDRSYINFFPPLIIYPPICVNRPRTVWTSRFISSLLKDKRLFGSANTAQFALHIPAVRHDFKVLAFNGAEAISALHAIALNAELTRQLLTDKESCV